MLDNAKQTYHQTEIENFSKDLFRLVDDFCHPTKEPNLPQCDSKEEIAEVFATLIKPFI